MVRKVQPQGFSVIGLLVIVAVIVAIGITGWYVWHKDANNQAVKATTGSQASTEKTKERADPSEGGKYLVIGEWGVRVLLPDSLKSSVFYALRDFDENYGHVEAADINSKLFQPECRDTAGDLGLDIIRTTTPPNDTTSYKHLGSYWYSSIFGKDGCSKFLTGTKADAFNELQKSIVTVQTIN